MYPVVEPTKSQRSWVGWLECKCDAEQNCEWYNKNELAYEYIYCTPPGAIRRDEGIFKIRKLS